MSYKIKLKLPQPIVQELAFHKDEMGSCAFSITGDAVVVDLLSVNDFFFGLKKHLSEIHVRALKKEMLKQLQLKIQRAKKPFSIRVYQDTLDLIDKETYWLSKACSQMANIDFGLAPVPTKPNLRLV